MSRFKGSQFGRGLLALVATLLADSTLLAGESIAPPRHVEPALGGHLDRPVVLYVRDPTSPCFRDYVPTPAEVSERATVEFATNEYEPLQLGLYVPSARDVALKKVTIDVDCQAPHRIGHLYYEPRARRRLLDHGRDYDGRRPSMPLYVMPGRMIEEVKPGQSAAFWLTFGDSRGVEPGVYTATIVIAAEGIDPVQHDVKVRVYPFALPRPRAAFGCYYRIDRVPIYYGRTYQEMYLRDQAEHGHNCAQIISCFSKFGTDEYLRDDKAPLSSWMARWSELLAPSDLDKGVFDPEQFLHAQLEMCKEAKLTHADMPVFGVQDNPYGPRKEFIANKLRELTASRGWPEILLYMRDEPPAWPGDDFGDEEVQHIAQYKRLPQCRNVAALDGASAAAWGHLHDVWIVLGGYPTPEMVREAARQQSEVWTYLHDLRITNTVANRYFAGLYTWGLGLDGNAPYAYHHGENGMQHPVYLPELRRPSREQVMGFILPGPDGPIPGVGYEMRREGIDDYRYLQLLEARIAAANAEDAGKLAAEKWLSSLKTQIEVAALRGSMLDFVAIWDLDWLNPNPNFAASKYAAVRDAAADFILQLPPAPGELNTAPEARNLPVSGLEGDAFAVESLAACINVLRSGTIAEQRAAICAVALKSVTERSSISAESIESLGVAAETPETRIPALRALRTLGPAALSAIPTVKAQLNHADPFVRMHAVLTLDAMGPKAIDPIVESLADAFPGVSRLAAEALGRKGRGAASALPALEQALQSANPRVRISLIAAIREIRSDEVR